MVRNNMYYVDADTVDDIAVCVKGELDVGYVLVLAGDDNGVGFGSDSVGYSCVNIVIMIDYTGDYCSQR